MNSPFAVLVARCLVFIIHTTKTVKSPCLYTSISTDPWLWSQHVGSPGFFDPHALQTQKIPCWQPFLLNKSSHDMKSKIHWLQQVPKWTLFVFVTYSLFYIIHRAKICYIQPVLKRQIWQNPAFKEANIWFKIYSKKHTSTYDEVIIYGCDVQLPTMSLYSGDPLGISYGL